MSNENSNYNKKAYGMFKTGATYSVVEIPYNNKTLDAGSAKVVKSDLQNLAIAIEEFKLSVTHNSVFSSEE